MAKVRVGRLLLNESDFRPVEANHGDSGAFQFTLSGSEASTSANPVPYLRRIASDVTNMYNAMVAVSFDVKTNLNGYYYIVTCDAKVTEWNGHASLVEWTMDLRKIGASNDIDIESRLSGSPALLNDFAGAGERWHAPPIGHTAYWSGPAQPAEVARASADGSMVVYRGVDGNTNPRFNCGTTKYHLGRARFIDADSYERVGVDFRLSAEGWTLENALVRVKRVAAAANTLDISAFDGTQWETIAWDITIGGTPLTVPVSTSVIRNDMECVVIRMLWNESPSGRITADLTLRRGSRFVEIYVQTMLSRTIGVKRHATEAATTASGYIVATSNDGAGNKYIVGSARTATQDLTNGGLSKATTVTFDAFVGVLLNGSSAISGDQAANLYQQYLGCPAEYVTGVRL